MFGVPEKKHKNAHTVMVLRYDVHGLFKKKRFERWTLFEKIQADKHGSTFTYSTTEQHGSTHFLPELELELEHDPDPEPEGEREPESEPDPDSDPDPEREPMMGGCNWANATGKVHLGGCSREGALGWMQLGDVPFFKTPLIWHKAPAIIACRGKNTRWVC